MDNFIINQYADNLAHAHSIKDEVEMRGDPISSDRVYDLFGVVVHTGNINGGHYKAIA
jgi:ubiquitin C-terminal hydrolase